MKKLLNKRRIIMILIIAIIITIDLLSKYFTENTNIVLIPNILSIFYSKNTGGAWSILSNYTWLLAVFSIVFLAGFIVWDIKFKNNSKLYTIALTFIIGGAIGNLIDRILLGYVRDFIRLDFINFPIFNFADSFLVVGVILMIIFCLFFYEKSYSKQKDKKEDKQ